MSAWEVRINTGLGRSIKGSVEWTSISELSVQIIESFGSWDNLDFSDTSRLVIRVFIQTPFNSNGEGLSRMGNVIMKFSYKIFISTTTEVWRRERSVMLKSINLHTIYLDFHPFSIPGIDEIELEVDLNLFVWGKVRVGGWERSGFFVAAFECVVTSVDLEVSAAGDNCTGVYISELPIRI